MNVQEAILIFNCIEHEGSKGSGLIKLSQETRLDISRLQKYLSKYPEYFSSNEDSPNILINQQGKYAGSTNLMLNALVIENQKKSKRKIISSIVGVLVGITIIVYLTSQIEAVQMIFNLPVAN